jgi:hypothetical protein
MKQDKLNNPDEVVETESLRDLSQWGLGSGLAIIHSIW